MIADTPVTVPRDCIFPLIVIPPVTIMFPLAIDKLPAVIYNPVFVTVSPPDVITTPAELIDSPPVMVNPLVWRVAPPVSVNPPALTERPPKAIA
jgi:hypothetical protein